MPTCLPCSVRVCQGVRPSTRVAAATQVVEAAPAVLDVDAMHKRLEARAKALIALEEQEAKTRTKVKFVLPFKVGLGEAWKIVGKCPELGQMMPEVAPFMQWNNGDVWTLEVPVRSGKFVYKAVLRKPDGQYLWEDGKDRVLEVSYGQATQEIKLDNVKFPPM